MDKLKKRYDELHSTINELDVFFMRLSHATLVALLTLTSSNSTFAADAARGEQLARRWCVACHVVAADQRQANADAPSFASIANRPGFDARRLAFLLLSPHPVMPELALRRSEAEDIVAYIGKLRSTRSEPRTAPK